MGFIQKNEYNDYFKYDKESGIVTRIKTNGKRGKVGDVLGRLRKDGYLQIKINGKYLLLHRVIWHMVYSEEPEFVDHINHNRSDNRIENLRSITKAENLKNRTKQLNNSSGVNGVQWHKQHNKWYSSIGVDGKNVFLGLFIEFSEAVNARKNAEVLYGFHKNHGKG